MESVSQVCSENCEMTMAVVIVPAGGEGSMCGVGHVVKASHSCSSPAGKVTPALSGLVFHPLSFFLGGGGQITMATSRDGSR